MLRHFVVNICDDCVNLRGDSCSNPDCCFYLRSMEEVGRMLDLLIIRPVHDEHRSEEAFGEVLPLNRGNAKRERWIDK